MSKETVMKMLTVSEQVSKSKFMLMMDKLFKERFSKVEFNTISGDFACRVKSSIISEMIKISGKVSAGAKDNRMKVIVEYDTSPSVWFWVACAASVLFFFPLLILDAVLYLYQKKQVKTCMDGLMSNLEFYLD